MRKRMTAGLVVLLAVIFTSCKKDSDQNPAEKDLVINFQHSALAAADVDSADVVFSRQGSNTPVFQRLIKKDNTLRTTLDGLPVGNWTATLSLYTKKQTGNKSYQYITDQPVAITGNRDDVTINGPAGQANDDWEKRLVMSTDDNNIVVIIPLEVTNPYFEIRTKGLEWNLFGIERTAVYNRAVIAHKTWTCTNDCPGNDRIIYNSDYFADFTEIIKTTEWKRNDISVTVGNQQTQLFYDFEHQWSN